MPISVPRSLIPNMVTCLGLVCAGYAIILMLEGNLILGGTLVIITALMDGIRGQVIKVKNEGSGRIVSGTVIEAGVVMVK